jgi:WD40 repeat protein
MYGASGVGKTSLLKAGVVPRLDKEPRVAVVVFRQWQEKDFQLRLREKVLTALLKAISVLDKEGAPRDLAQLRKALNESLATQFLNRPQKSKRESSAALQKSPQIDDLTLDRFLVQCANAIDGRIFFIIDQFEEYFLYHPLSEKDNDFEGQFASAVNHAGIPASFLISLREEGLSKLDRLTARIPDLMQNMLRIEHLSQEGAIEAIKRPLDRTWDGHQVTIEDQLVSRLCKDLVPGKVGFSDIEQTVRDQNARKAETHRVDSSFLQLVLTSLWERELANGAECLTLRTYADPKESGGLGGAKQIIRDYFDDIMGERLKTALPSGTAETKIREIRNIAASLFKFLVTATDSKVAWTVDELAGFTQDTDTHKSLLEAGRSWPDEVLATLEVLEKLRVVRRAGSGVLCSSNEPEKEQATRKYEIWHDVLATAVRTWREKHERQKAEEKAKAEAQQEKAAAEKRELEQHRLVVLTRRVAYAFFLLFLVALGAFVWAFSENSARRENLRQASWGSFNQADRLMQLGFWSEGVLHLAQAVRSNPENEVAAERFFHELMINRAQARRVAIPSFRHEGDVFQGVFSSDGTRVLTASTGNACLWDAVSGKLIRTFQQEGVVYQAIFDSGDRRVLTVGTDKTAKLWDATSGHLLQTFQHDGEVLRAIFDRNNRRILTASVDGTARLWDAASGNLIRSFRHKGPVLRAVFSPDGSLILTASADSTARLWNAQTGDPVRSFQHQGPVRQAAFGPDGGAILTASEDRTARLWKASTGELIKSFEHSNKVSDAVFGSDGESILTVSEDRFAWLWNATTGELFHLFPHSDIVGDAVFSPNGAKRILTASSDKTAKLWDAESGKLLCTFEHASGVLAAAFSLDGNRILTIAKDRTARVWEANSMELRPSFQHEKAVSMAVFSPDGRHVLTGSGDRTAELWDEESQKKLYVFPHVAGVTKTIFDRDGQRILTLTEDNVARLWDAVTYAQLWAFQNKDAISDVVFSPDGRFILVGSLGDAKLLESASGKVVSAFQYHAVVYGVAFATDGKRILTASADDTARLWDTTSGKLLQTFPHRGPVLQAVFSPDGRHVLTASADKTAKLWDADTGALIESFQHDSFVKHAIFGPDGTAILTTSGASAADLWDAGSGKLIHSFQHADTVQNGVFSPRDGQLILTASADKTAKLWDRASGKLLACFQHDAPVMDATFNSDGDRILTTSGDRAELWNAVTPRLIFEQLRHSSQELVSETESLAEMVAGAELEGGFPVPFPDERRKQLDDELRRKISAARKSPNDRFLYWFMSGEKERTIFPDSNEPANHWADQSKRE